MRGAGIMAVAVLAGALALGQPLMAQDARTPITADPPLPAPGRTPAETGMSSMMVTGHVGNGDSNSVLPVITLDQDRLYMESAWGTRVQGDLERIGREIGAENDRLEKQFSDEETQLTELRKTLPPDEFRKRADEFDKRVVEVRRERENAARELQARASEERSAFFRAALPVLAAFMHEKGAVAVLDQRAIFVAAEDIDVTDALGKRLDAEIGEGPSADTSGAPANPADSGAAPAAP